MRKLAIAAALVQAVIALAVVLNSHALRRRRPPVRSRAAEQEPEFTPVPLADGCGSVQLFVKGDVLLDDICEAIGRARSRVLVETFIWVDDPAGRRVAEALRGAAERGVRVFVVWDPLLGNAPVDRWLVHPNISVFAFKPLRAGLGALHPRSLLRDHRKVVCVDRDVAFVGGFNFGEEYLRWRDTHVRVDGIYSLELANAFIDFWNRHRPRRMPPIPDERGRTWRSQVVVHRNDPSFMTFPIRGMLLEAIDRADRRAWITTAYFVPDPRFRESLMHAAERGVDVRVLLPEHSNHPLTDALAHGMFDALLARGVRVFRYRSGMLHAKTAVIDGTWATVGTANLDRWSMLGNYEINLEVRSDELAAQLEVAYEHDLACSREVDPHRWRERPLRMRIAERALSSLGPLL